MEEGYEYQVGGAHTHKTCPHGLVVLAHPAHGLNLELGAFELANTDINLRWGVARRRIADAGAEGGGGRERTEELPGKCGAACRGTQDFL